METNLFEMNRFMQLIYQAYDELRVAGSILHELAEPSEESFLTNISASAHESRKCSSELQKYFKFDNWAVEANRLNLLVTREHKNLVAKVIPLAIKGGWPIKRLPSQQWAFSYSSFLPSLSQSVFGKDEIDISNVAVLKDGKLVIDDTEYARICIDGSVVTVTGVFEDDELDYQMMNAAFTLFSKILFNHLWAKLDFISSRSIHSFVLKESLSVVELRFYQSDKDIAESIHPKSVEIVKQFISDPNGDWNLLLNGEKKVR